MRWMGWPALTPRARRDAAARLALAVGLTVAVIGCGADDSERPGDETGGEVVDISGTEPLGEQTAGSVAQLVQCRDWNRGNKAEKLATIADVRGQVHAGGSGIEAPPLSDDEAMDVFDNACRPAYAQGFRLYLLYARAAGVAPLTRER